MIDLTPPSGLFAVVSDKANCTISFEAEANVTTDVNGFPVISTNTVELSARAYKENRAVTTDLFPPGSDTEGELLRGRLNSPLTFPALLKDLSIVRLTFADGRTGTARIRIKTSNPLVSDTALGQRFYLLFRQD
jgi:hypothetical protein